MENKHKPVCMIVREVEDGQLVPVSNLENYDQAEKLISSLSEYWPGEYSIVQADGQEFVPLPVSFSRPQIAQ
jgi:hypothetical protein